jgi:radical SAM superfamily enzyme YgiQ (UPF0313 family)
MRAVDLVGNSGFKQVKLYFMTGLPGEDENDVHEIIDLILRIKKRIESTGCRLVLSVEPFIPKPNTPFQWLPMAGQATLENGLKTIRSSLRKKGVSVNRESVEWCIVQAVLSRGDDKLGRVLAGMSGVSLSAWRHSMKEQDLSADSYAFRLFSMSESLPWSIVDSGISCDYLISEFNNALQI